MIAWVIVAGSVVAVVLIRRDVTVDVRSDLWAGEFGVKASSKVWP